MIACICSVVDITQNFSQTIALGRPTMVKFYAEWCNHCVYIKDKYELLADIAPQDYIIAEVDCVKNQQLCMQLDVRGYPTVRFYANGKFDTNYTQQKEARIMLEWISVRVSKIAHGEA